MSVNFKICDYYDNLLLSLQDDSKISSEEGKEADKIKSKHNIYENLTNHMKI
jgi:hypothetical protein